MRLREKNPLLGNIHQVRRKQISVSDRSTIRSVTEFSILFLAILLLDGGLYSNGFGEPGIIPAAAKQRVLDEIVQNDPPVASVFKRLDVIFIEGSRIPWLCGKKIEDVRVYSFRKEGLKPIPFQIDEYKPDGSLVLTGGKKATEDPDPLFDANDLLMFLARDLGDKALSTPLPAMCPAVDLEIQATDPLDGSKGWAYLACRPNLLPLSPVSYVRYTIKDGEIDNIDTRYYSIHYPWGAYYSDTMFLYPKTACQGVDFLDRLKTRGRFTMFFSIIKIDISEEKMGAKVVGYRSGPIRVVRRVGYWADLGLGLRSPSFLADIIYYDSFMNAPITTKIPVHLDLFFSKAYGEIGTDYNREAYGMMFKNSNNLEGVLIDGRMSPQEKRLDLNMDVWRLITGSQGTFFRGKLPENDMISQVKVNLVYVDDIDREDPPEGEPGQVGHIYDRVDIIGLKPGTYKTDIVFLVPPDYEPGDENLYLEWEKTPLCVEVQEFFKAGEAL